METAEIKNNPQENISGIIGGIVFQKNNILRIRPLVGRRKRKTQKKKQESI